MPTGAQLFFPEQAFNANSLKGSGGVYNSHNLNLYHYAGWNPVKYTDPTGMWKDNGDGSFIAEKGDTLIGLQKETGRDWKTSDFKGDPTKLQIGQKVSFAAKNEANSDATVDSNSDAVSHYYGGSGQSVNLGPTTTNLLKNHPEQQRREGRIRGGQTSSLSGNYGVNMESSMFHVGQTTVDYNTTCGSKSCVTNFTGFARDAFRDPLDMERLGLPVIEPGGTPYPYNPYNWTISYPTPYKGR